MDRLLTGRARAGEYGLTQSYDISYLRTCEKLYFLGTWRVLHDNFQEKDIDRRKESVSRRNFLKIAGAGGLILGMGGLHAFGGLLNKQVVRATHEPSANEQSFTYIIYTRGSETVAQKYIGGVYPGGGTNPIHSTKSRGNN